MQRSNYLGTSVLTFLFQLTYCVKFEEHLIELSSEYLHAVQYHLKSSENHNDNQEAFAITQNKLSIKRKNQGGFTNIRFKCFIFLIFQENLITTSSTEISIITNNIYSQTCKSIHINVVYM